MTARDRCPECDAPLATPEDHAAWLEAGEPDDYRPDLCWARPCRREPVDWRARALVAERERDEARRIAEQWRFNPWRGTTQSDPFPWERQP